MLTAGSAGVLAAGEPFPLKPSALLADGGVWDLPPLILYAFNERIPPGALLENSKAALMLSGMVPSDGSDPEDLRRRLLAGRYAEVRMLYYLGKDLLRWIDHCQDLVDRTPELRGNGLEPPSFASLLTGDPPENVREKPVSWGIADSATVFARAFCLNSIFTEAPKFDLLTSHFPGSYHHYGDALFRCFMGTAAFPENLGRQFPLRTLPFRRILRPARTTVGRPVAVESHTHRSRDQREWSLPHHA